jgi:hypothetical protein
MSNELSECEFCSHLRFNHQLGKCQVKNCRCDRNKTELSERPSFDEFLKLVNFELNAKPCELSLAELIANPKEMFEYLRGEYQEQFDKIVRSVPIEPESLEDKERLWFLVNGAFSIFFDTETHTAQIVDGKIIVTPK